MSEAQQSQSRLEPEDWPTQFADLLSQRPFEPPRWLRSGHAQTIAASFWKREDSPTTSWTESEVVLQDGTRVRLDCVWRDPSRPTLIAIHGLAGSSHSGYMLGFSQKALQQGWNTVLLELYDASPEGSRAKVFHAGVSQEVGEILAWVRRRSSGPVFVVGVSMGGNILLKLLGEWGAKGSQWVDSAAAISPLLDLGLSFEQLLKPSNVLYRRYFVKRLKAVVLQRAEHWSRFVDLDPLLSVRSVRAFDQAFTVPLGGFRDVQDYYQKASALPLLKLVRVPTLLIHAKDDPVLPWEPLLDDQVCSNPDLQICLTNQGGHVGFIGRPGTEDVDRFWAENRVIDFFRFQVRSTES